MAVTFLFKVGYIGKVEVLVEYEGVISKAIVRHSEWIITFTSLDSTLYLHGSLAGIGEARFHAIALLFAAEANSPCSWSVPSCKKVEYAPI